MKTYKKVEMVAKNAPSGSYAAGCPQYQSGHGYENGAMPPGHPQNSCKYCETTK